jgi:two-component system invasion response regulator UvrY
MTEARTRVMLVDDHAVVRMGFRLLLEGSPELKVIAEAESGEEALRLYPEVHPDVVVMDISMPGMGGLEAIGRILAKHAGARILVLSAHADAMHARRVMKAGALGYLSKRSAGDALVHAIAQVRQGRTFIEAAIAQQLATQQFGGEKSPVEALSEKEFSVFIELAKGRTVAEIADAMSLSPRTIGTHLYNVKQKLSATNQAELTLIAVRDGLIDP